MELPYNLEAEKQVIANMIFSSDVLVETLAVLNEDDFYVKAHQLIYKALRELYMNNNAKIEAYALIDRLSVNNVLEEVGDASYILELVNAYNDISNSKYYINAVQERSILRRLITLSNKICNKWPEESKGDLQSYITKIEKDVNDITKKRRVEDFTSINQAIESFKNRVELARNGNLVTTGLETGYSFLDRVLLGFKPGEVYILAARPAVGKSALALNLLYRVALKNSETPCVFFSLEMGVEMVTNRILSAASKVNMRRIQTGQLSRDDEMYLNKAINDLSNTKLFIDDTPAIKVVDMRAKLNKLQSRFGSVGLIVVDYIGLISPDVKSKGNESRAVELGAISASLKALARDYHCPIIVLSQLNRSIEQRTGTKIPGQQEKTKRPQLSDLRESGSIEQDADVVMFIHREDYGQANANQEENLDKPSNSPVTLIIAKNRNGSLADIDFMFEKHIGRFDAIESDKSQGE